MKLYHYYRSSASYRVRIALALKGLEWEAATVSLADGEHLSEEYARVFPSRLVPALETGSTVFSQSLAIMEYIDEVYGGPKLLPEDPQERAYARELSFDVACEIHPLNNRRVLVYLENELGLDQSAINQWYRHWTELGLQVIEEKLQSQQGKSLYCVGNTPTMADCCLVPQIFNAKRFDCDLSAMPNVMRAFENCMKLDAFSQTQPSCYDPAVIATQK